MITAAIHIRMDNGYHHNILLELTTERDLIHEVTKHVGGYELNNNVSDFWVTTFDEDTTIVLEDILKAYTGIGAY